MTGRNSSKIRRILCAIPRKVKIYDVEKKELIKECSSINEAQKFSGVKCISNYIKTKSKSYKNKLGKVICFR